MPFGEHVEQHNTAKTVNERPMWCPVPWEWTILVLFLPQDSFIKK